jgi:hypothetical protein
MCECIETINEKLKEGDTNTALDIPMMLSLSENTVRADRVSIKTRKINSKSRKKAQTVMGSYCPFCGNKYDA